MSINPFDDDVVQRPPSTDSPLPIATTPVTPVAVIGMACRLPGAIDSPEQLCEAFLRGDDVVTEIPPDRWDADEYYDPEPGVPGRSVSRWGAFIDDVAGLDPEFFGIYEREATAMDPQHRLLLESSWDAMEHAGLTREPIADSLTGAFMGADLLAAEPVFATTVAQAESVIARESGFSVTEAITAPQIVTGQDQPTLFTMHVAPAATMKFRGVRPGVVIGHSLGEVAAAVVAGALSLDDGQRVICRRSRLIFHVAGTGATASVELPARQVLSELTARGINDVVVTVVASPQSAVIAGAAQTVRDLVAAWEQRDVMARELPTDVYFNSPQVDPVMDELTEALAEISPMTPEVPFYSATLFDSREQPMCDARYWAKIMRRMVRFATAEQAASDDGYRVFAELAPHPLPIRALEQTARSREMTMATLAGVRREQALPQGLRVFVADLHSAGAAVDFSMLYPSGRLVDAPLPTWTHRRLWLSGGGQESPTHVDYPDRNGHTRDARRHRHHWHHSRLGRTVIRKAGACERRSA